jgi:hypothetical protein
MHILGHRHNNSKQLVKLCQADNAMKKNTTKLLLLLDNPNYIFNYL